MNTSSDSGLTERLTGLAAALRSHGVRVGTGETVDAARAVEALGLAGREQLREGLAATLLHHTGQRPVFDAVFDLYFPRGVGAPGGGPADRDALRDRLAAALADDDTALMGRLAAEAVDGFGGYGGSRGRTAGRRTRRWTGCARRPCWRGCATRCGHGAAARGSATGCWRTRSAAGSRSSAGW